MCGIAAIYAYGASAGPVDVQELEVIRDHLRKRGPDGKGSWINPNRRVGLAHRRLAIIDLDERASQPMTSSDGELVISFNGEIYNYQELRAGLEAKGRTFRTSSDTEVLLQLYQEYQHDMLPKLRGMYAFVIWDQQRGKLFMARDPYGIKPLYISDHGKVLRVASQVKALLASDKTSREPDSAGLAGFLMFGSVPEPFTLYRDIRQLPAGHYCFADQAGLREPVSFDSLSGIYSELGQDKEGESLATPDAIREALLESVRYHLVADVPVGAFLSAGIDSGALVGLMRDAGVQDIQTITLGFEEFRGRHEDETPLAARVAEQYRTRHSTRWVSRSEFERDQPAIMDAMDQPSIDGINTWFVSKAAAEQGLKIAVSGLGGDELFGGYPSFRDVPRWVRQLSWSRRIPGLGMGVRKLATPFVGRSGALSPKSAGLLEFGGCWPGAWLLKRGLFMPWELPGLIGEDVAHEALSRLDPLALIDKALHHGSADDFSRVALMESSLYMRNQLLRDSDWAGMAHSLEIRVPLVDAALLRHAASIRPVDPSAWNKQLLAVAPAHAIPREISERAKSGFTTPISEWISGSKETSNTPWARPWALEIIDSFMPGTLATAA